MCGIAGFFSLNRAAPEEELQQIAQRMSCALMHRGPDGEGIWTNAAEGIGLAQRRLAIIDLSPAGKQPMFSVCGRYVIVFNGEIYNYPQLREELGATESYRGHSDTEVLLAAIRRWGLAEALRRSVGMFALALWDRQEHTLWLARDRMGEKPLYYGVMGDTLLFGSELKGLRCHPAWRGEVNREALALFMRHNYIPAPYTIYTGVHKLLPGTLLRLPCNGAPQAWHSLPQAFWSVREQAQAGQRQPFTGDDAAAVDELDRLLRQSVAGQMLADVPLGAFLSGGIDSSTVVALMQAQSDRPVRTFTIGFSEAGFNEAKHAKVVAAHLGTEHTELYISPQEAQAVIPHLPTLYDEPFADSSQIPTFLVSQLARRHVTVSLSGDGGDELFGGYDRYRVGKNLWQKIQRIPLPVRHFVAAGIDTVVPYRTSGLLPPGIQHILMTSLSRGHKLAEVMRNPSARSFYRQIVSHWKQPTALVLHSNEPETILTRSLSDVDSLCLLQQMMVWDMLSYLPDDILVKVDRASMGVSLESRAPLLDHRVVEFALSLPLGLKVRNGQGKWLLRQVLDRYVPSTLIDRPKMGFGVPIHEWLRGPLRGWAEELLSVERLRREGYLHAESVRSAWTAHLDQHPAYHSALWNVLMFQAWLAEESAPKAGAAN
ncbi:MAG: asparagine synthase (glutamine-hydrolyzing) [Caldilineaceae bacterium]